MPKRKHTSDVPETGGMPGTPRTVPGEAASISPPRVVRRVDTATVTSTANTRKRKVDVKPIPAHESRAEPVVTLPEAKRARVTEELELLTSQISDIRAEILKLRSESTEESPLTAHQDRYISDLLYVSRNLDVLSQVATTDYLEREDNEGDI